MKSTIKILSLLAVLCVALPSTVSAADKAKADKSEKKAEPAKGKSVYTPLYAQVESITPTLLTVKAGAETKFIIAADTKITKDEAHKAAGTVADAKVGQWVGGSYTKTDAGNVLHSLNFGVSQKGNAGKKAEKK